jgi:diguanylate cyclase (GGDEF)-like protein
VAAVGDGRRLTLFGCYALFIVVHVGVGGPDAVALVTDVAAVLLDVVFGVLAVQMARAQALAATRRLWVALVVAAGAYPVADGMLLLTALSGQGPVPTLPGDMSNLIIDLDDFKTINDTMGHHAGDAVLVAVGRRMRAAFRADDVTARRGGDKFAVLVEGLGADEVAQLVERLLDRLSEPLEVPGGRLPISAGVGVAITHGGTAEQLVRQADAAMYQAKASGKGRFAVT